MPLIQFPSDHFVIPTSDRYLFYVPLKGLLYSLNLSALQQLSEAIQGGHPAHACDPVVAKVCDDLCTTECLLPDEVSMNDLFRWNTVVLDLSTDCTLSCCYCYAGTSPADSRSMAFKCATAAIDLCVSRVRSLQQKYGNNQDLRLVFHGGSEPTTNWQLFVDVIEYAKDICREQGLQLSISMSTNGYYSEERAKWITQNLTNISLSFDGYAEVQDAQRLKFFLLLYYLPAKNGSNSFDIVFKSAKIFMKSTESGFKFGLRPTVTASFVEYLPQIVGFFQEHFPGIPIGIEPVQECGRCRQSLFRTPNPYKFVQKFIEASKDFPSANLTYSGFAGIGTLRRGFCGASRPQFAVLTSGIVTSCFGYPLKEALLDEFVFGHYDERTQAFVFNEDHVTWLRGLNALKNTNKCRNCFAKYHCGGDCPALRLAALNASREKNGRSILQSERCIISRELTKWTLESEVKSHDPQFERRNLQERPVQRHSSFC